MTTKRILGEVKKETMLAYRDCQSEAPFGSAEFEKRMLDWSSQKSLTVEEWVMVMEVALSGDGGYNNFIPKLVGDFIKELAGEAYHTLRVYPARESSVCCYLLATALARL